MGTQRMFTDWKTVNVTKMAVLPKLTYRFNAILITIPAAFFVQTDKLILKFIWNF